MMKKIIAVLMAVTMCVGFSSCGNSSSDESSADKSEKEATTETTTADCDFIKFYNNLKNKYEKAFTDSYYKFDDFFDVSESHFSFCQLTSEGMMNLTLNEADTYFEMSDEFATFMSENEQILTGSVVKKSDYNIFTLEKKDE